MARWPARRRTRRSPAPQATPGARCQRPARGGRFPRNLVCHHRIGRKRSARAAPERRELVGVERPAPEADLVDQTVKFSPRGREVFVDRSTSPDAPTGGRPLNRLNMSHPLRDSYNPLRVLPPNVPARRGPLIVFGVGVALGTEALVIGAAYFYASVTGVAQGLSGLRRTRTHVAAPIR
jgi:hypothetical protein